MGILLSSAHNREFPLDPSKSGDVEFFEEEPTRYCLVEPVCEVSRSLSELVRMLADLLSESYDAYLEEPWENERMATPARAFPVRLHQTGCSLRETTTILVELGVEHSHEVGYLGWLTALQTADGEAIAGRYC